MPDHFHFLIHTDHRSAYRIQQGQLIIDALTNSIRKLLSNYAQIFNNRYRRSGSLFRQKTKSECLTNVNEPLRSIQDNRQTCIELFNYIHLNPVLAGLVTDPEKWEFSSYNDYAALRNTNLCDKVLAAQYCGYDPAGFVVNTIDWLRKI
jgi:putative transposase